MHMAIWGALASGVASRLPICLKSRPPLGSLLLRIYNACFAVNLMQIAALGVTSLAKQPYSYSRLAKQNSGQDTAGMFQHYEPQLYETQKPICQQHAGSLPTYISSGISKRIINLREIRRSSEVNRQSISRLTPVHHFPRDDWSHDPGAETNPTRSITTLTI